MSEAVTFQDLETALSSDFDKPFFAIDHSNEDTVLNWLKNELNRIDNDNVNADELCKNNYLRYKGMQYFNTIYQPRDVLEAQRKYVPQLVLPLISDAIDEKTARLMEVKPYVTVLPKNDETIDKQDVRVAKSFLSHVDYTQKLDGKFTQTVLSSKIDGEAFVWIRWNPDLGDSVADDEMANIIETNPELKAKVESLKNGDVEVILKSRKNVRYPKVERWDLVDYVFIIEYDWTEAVKRDYPEKADKITDDADCEVFNYETMRGYHLRNRVKKVHFYHRKTKYLPEGYECCFVKAALLKHGPLQYAHGDLPIERLCDLKTDKEISGQSMIDKTKAMVSQINNMINMAIKMYALAGMAKWFVQAGAVDDEQLNNDLNIVKVKQGADKPILAQANPVGQGHFQFIDKLMEWYYNLSKSSSVVRGEPPPGVTAFVALQFVSESESRRLKTEVQDVNSFVQNVYDKVLKTCAQFYKKDEKRTMMVLGRDNQWEMQDLNIEAILKPYVVVLQNTSGLSESKALRTQQVLDLEKTFPGMVPREQVAEMTGLAQGEKFLDVAARAVRAAEDENQKMSEDGVQVPPEKWEEHVTHWKIHVQEMQPMGFKEKASPEVKKAFEEHIMTHEMFMQQAALVNPAYQAQLAMLPGFPLFMLPLPPSVTNPIPTELPPPDVPQEMAPAQSPV